MKQVVLDDSSVSFQMSGLRGSYGLMDLFIAGCDLNELGLKPGESPDGADFRVERLREMNVCRRESARDESQEDEGRQLNIRSGSISKEWQPDDP